MPKPDRLSPRDGSDYVASVSSLVQHYCTCENCLGMPSATIAGRNALEELKYIEGRLRRSLSTDTVNACIRHGLRVTSA